ncbi:hypothetical protein GCM10025877_28030 [Agromyces mangrovi Wang et al. 2018]|nr:hypothetical protein GCM10025877_28030 [Agromyces mangrovi]
MSTSAYARRVTALHELSAVAQRDLLQRGDVSPTELVAHYLARIERLGARYGAFTTVQADAALARAALVESSTSPAAPLWGMPHADKDLVRRAGVPTGFGSRAFAGFVPDESDPLATDLDAAGAVSVGKTATPEFGLTSSAQSLASPPVRHPLDPSLDPGGSSGERPSRSRPDSCRSRPGPMAAARSASPPPRAAWSASSPRGAACPRGRASPCSAGCRWRAPSGATSRTRRCCWTA